MRHPAKKRICWLVLGLSLGLLFMGLLRASASYPNGLAPLAKYATPGYVLVTALFTVLLARAGLPLGRFGFGVGPVRRQILLSTAAIVILRIFAFTLEPWVENLVGSPRNLERFSNLEGSLVSLVVLLMTNWTLAAFGEEFAYRIVLMRGLSVVFGDSRSGRLSVLLLQAVMFGLIHAYQGPAGIIGAACSGLVFGAVTLAGRWSIWPSAIAHGINNTIGIFSLYNRV